MIPTALRPHRDFLRFWWARLAGTCASQMLMVAVGWQMYDLTGSAWDLGLVGLLQFLPALALVLVTGDVADRTHRARLAALCVGAQAGVALVLALSPWAALPQRELLLALSVVLGAISLDLFAVLLGGATALLPMFAKAILHVGPWGLGLLRGAPAVGALLMSVALPHWPITRRAGPRMLGAVAVYGLATVVFGLSTSFELSMLALAVVGAADMISVVVRQSLVQLETPDAMRGRVSAVNSVFIGASNQLGEFESGATAALLGPVGSVVLGGVGSVAIALLWWRRFPALATRDEMVRSA